MKVILLSGKQGSGKTSTADAVARGLMAHGIPMPKDHIKKEVGEVYILGPSVMRIRFAQPLYEMHDAVLKVLASYGVVRPELVKDGPLLQLLGTEWGRKTIDENIWVDLVRNSTQECGADFVVIDDARFENEFNAFGAPRCLRVRLEAPQEVRKSRCSMWRDVTDHPSEVSLDAYASDRMFDLYLDTENQTKEENVTKIMEAIKDRGWL